ncbi:MAG TPA: 2-amino-4-hydroxy-6-hydroxymethyldihydropteridine diphosphokinase [Bryobacteraceae bacterium]|nr:2-amino-4-hydroxy-6-hydroxymethyldihydropteridine diphosphokinase [Bryobacteraceae bacterium]
MKTIYLALGSNIGNRQNNLREAIQAMPAAGILVLRESPVYETEPVGYRDQGWFLNMVVEAETTLFPMQLLARTGKIERMMGRVRTIPNGPRSIDIDILLYGNAVVRTKRLEIPHPRMQERRFVLAPLADLKPDVRHPVSRKTAAQMLQEAPAGKVRQVK